MVPKSARINVPPSGFFGWFTCTIREPLESLPRLVGLDAYFYLRYVKFLIQLNCILAVIMIPILLPIHFTGSPDQSTDFLSRFSIANIGADNSACYTAHLILSIFSFIVCMGLFYHELMSYEKIRAKHMVRNYLPCSSTILLIKGLHTQYNSPELLMHHFGNQADHIQYIWFNRDYSELTSLVEKQQSTLHKLETEISWKATMKAMNDVAPFWASWIARVQRPKQSVPLLLDELNSINGQTLTFQSQQDIFNPVNSCFIRFENRLSCYIASRSFGTSEYGKPTPGTEVYSSVCPEEIIWSNLSMSTWLEWCIYGLAVTADYIVIFGWAIPVAVVSMVTQVEYLAQLAPSLTWMLAYPNLAKFMNSVIAPTALSCLTSQVPRIFRALAHWKGYPTKTMVEMDIQKYLFVFLFVQLFLIVTLATGLPGLVLRMVVNTSEGAISLASSLPKATNFFISYLVASALTTAGNSLLQIEALWNRCWLEFWSMTPRARFNKMYKFPKISWGTCFPLATNIGAISLAYALVSPLILVAALGGTSVLFVAFKYRVTYTYVPRSTADGNYYPRAIFQLFSGIYCQQLSLMGTLLLVNLPIHAFFAGMLLVGSINAHHYLNKTFQNVNAKIPIESAQQRGNHESTSEDGDESDVETSSSSYWGKALANIDVECEKISPGEREILNKQILNHPSVRALRPVIWIPKDPANYAASKVDEINSRYANVRASCSGAKVDPSGEIIVTQVPPDFDLLKILKL